MTRDGDEANPVVADRYVVLALAGSWTSSTLGSAPTTGSYTLTASFYSSKTLNRERELRLKPVLFQISFVQRRSSSSQRSSRWLSSSVPMATQQLELYACLWLEIRLVQLFSSNSLRSSPRRPSTTSSHTDASSSPFLHVYLPSGSQDCQRRWVPNC